ncbi:MAG: hypothetical protein ABH872_06820 [Candidatus Omnitrophota bacterium]
MENKDEKQKKSKGFLTRLVDKIGKKLKQCAESQPCCGGDTKKNGDKPCCKE